MHENTTLDSTLDSLITTTTRLTPLTTPGLPPAQHALASSRDTTVLWGCYVQVELLLSGFRPISKALDELVELAVALP